MTTPNTTPAPRQWFLSPGLDLLLIVGTPLLIWPLIMAGQQIWSAESLNRWIFLTATGHYFATFLRAYGDRDLWRRYRARLTVIPLLLLGTCLLCLSEGYGAALLLVVGFWAWWHWIAQAFGFARIYDAKIGSHRLATARLDKALVVSWFFGAIVLNQNATRIFTTLLLNSGIPLPGAEFFAALRTGTAITLGLVTLAYLGNLVLSRQRGEPISWIKQLCHLSNIGCYWFAFGYMPNFLVAYVIYELFHDIQYFAITWVACRGRVQKPGAGALMRWVFAPGLSRLLLFLALLLSFGALDVWSRPLHDDAGVAADLVVSLVLTAAVLHYYYDGFIWKMRDASTRTDLGMAAGSARLGRHGIRHAVSWGLFFAALWFAVERQTGHAIPEPAKVRMLAASTPGSFQDQENLARQLVEGGDLKNGLVHYRRAVEIHPAWTRLRVNYAAALDLHGSYRLALVQYDAALQLPDAEDLHQQCRFQRLISLGMAGDPAAARQAYQALTPALRAKVWPRVQGLADHRHTRGFPRRGAALLELAAQLDPSNPKARSMAGDRYLDIKDWGAAADQFRQVLERAPRYKQALFGMARAKLGQGLRQDARRFAQQALLADPDYAPARELLRQLGGR